MPFTDLIQKIQNKPRHIRIQILWGSVLVIMFIVVFLWVVSLKHAVSQPSQEKEPDQITESFNQVKQEIPSLKEAFKASIGSFFENDLEQIIEEPAEQTQEENIFQLKEIKPAKLPLSN